MLNQKIQVHLKCVQLIEDKLDLLQGLIDSAQKASSEDTKSSAGDKYETSREMMQAEKDKAYGQIAEVSKMRKVLSEINSKEKHTKIGLGSFFNSSIGYFYLSVALGEIEIEGIKVFAISPVSPIGKELVGLSENDKINFNGRDVEILDLI